jgi:hypothetical protein
MPHTEILFEPFGPEPRIGSLEGCLERNRYLALLNLQFRDLKAKRTLAQRHKA